MFKSILITGVCGFIGSAFANYTVKKYPQIKFLGVDIMSYCSSMKHIQEIQKEPNFTFVKADVTNLDFMAYLFKEHNIDAVIHFAAYSHVDLSFGNSLLFTQNNIVGTHTLLEVSKLTSGHQKIKKFIYVSTDECYGNKEDCSSEMSTLNASNPYSATKSAAECIANAYIHSFKLPVIITRGNNVYGPMQYPEKVIPKFLQLALKGEPLTIQGSGLQRRSFIFIEDVVKAYELILFEGTVGEIYNIGTTDEFTVLEIAKQILQLCQQKENKEGKIEEKEEKIEKIKYIQDRDFNDQRYLITTNKLTALGWKQEISFQEGLKRTFEWYKMNPNYF